MIDQLIGRFASSLANKIAWLLEIHPEEWSISGCRLYYNPPKAYTEHGQYGGVNLQIDSLTIWVANGSTWLDVELNDRKIIELPDTFWHRFLMIPSADQMRIWSAYRLWDKTREIPPNLLEARERDRIQAAEQAVSNMLLAERATPHLALPMPSDDEMIKVTLIDNIGNEVLYNNRWTHHTEASTSHPRDKEYTEWIGPYPSGHDGSDQG